MSKARHKTVDRASASAQRTLEARFGSAFWDEVECEVEAMDVADFEAFLEADRLPIEPSPKFRAQLSGYLQDLVRARFSH